MRSIVLSRPETRPDHPALGEDAARLARLACRAAGDEGTAAAERLCNDVFGRIAPAEWRLAELVALLARADPRTDRQVERVLDELCRLSAEVEALAPARRRTSAVAA